MIGAGEVVGRVVATAPVRVADVGGWTDTWFGSPGRVCYVAMGPGVRVDAVLIGERPEDDGWPARVIAPDLGEDYGMGPSESENWREGWRHPLPGRQPLLEHAIAAIFAERPIPDDAKSVRVTITSAVPVGASLGTSASVVVAVIGAVQELVGHSERNPYDVATLAHEIETQRAGREAGVQDQWAAAMGGCGSLLVDPYPEVRHDPIPLDDDTATKLGERLVTVAFGPHDSSAMHHEVIDAVTRCDGLEYEQVRDALTGLASLALDAGRAIGNGDVDLWAEVLTESVAAQARLHPGLVGPAHQAAIEVGRRCDATGWKANGAGGNGGSLTLVARPGGADELKAALAATDPAWTILDLWPSVGLQVQEIR